MLKALGSDPRLKVIRLLIQHGDGGCCLTDIQKEIGCAASTLSHHLETLSRFGLIHSRKEAQWIFYSVNFEVLKELFSFLWQDCSVAVPGSSIFSRFGERRWGRASLFLDLIFRQI